VPRPVAAIRRKKSGGGGEPKSIWKEPHDPARLPAYFLASRAASGAAPAGVPPPGQLDPMTPIEGSLRMSLNRLLCTAVLILAAGSPAVSIAQLQPAAEPDRQTASPQTSATPPSSADAVTQVPAPLEPDWMRTMSAEERGYVEQLLDYWQASSQQIRQCTCDFTEWRYDPTYCNFRNPQTNELAAYAVWRGQIKYASPDKAMLETTEAWTFRMNQENQQPDLEKAEDDSLKQKWICDGGYVYEYDFLRKVLTDVAIPEAYRGEGLVNSPLPFLFGAQRQTMLERYWVHVITPPQATDEYWLEAVPKRIEDTRNYSRVQVVIARQDFLPKSMIVYPPNYDPQSPVSTAYVFENRRINSNLDKLRDFLQLFIRPSLPLGWTRQEHKAYGEDTITAQREQMNK
jgi:TIGR03009 family protein